MTWSLYQIYTLGIGTHEREGTQYQMRRPAENERRKERGVLYSACTRSDTIW